MHHTRLASLKSQSDGPSKCSSCPLVSNGRSQDRQVHITVRRGKARFPCGCESHPATVASAGSGQGGSWR